MDGLRGYYAKLNKSDKKRQIMYDFMCMRNLQIGKQTSKNKTHGYREQIIGCQKASGGGNG